MDTHSEKFSVNQASMVSLSPTLNGGNNHDSVDVVCCSCGDDDDSGFTIQCEECLTWQHGRCMNITPTRVPRYYICDSCQVSPHHHYLRHIDGQHLHDHSKQHQRKRKQQLDTTEYQLIHGNVNDKKKSRSISTHAHTTSTDDKHDYDYNADDDESMQCDNYDLTAIVKHESAPDASHFIKNASNKNRSMKQKGHADILKKRTTKDDDDDDETVTPYDYSTNITNSKATPKARRNSTDTRSTRSTGRFVQVYRNVIKNKLVKQIMKEAREQWEFSDDEASPHVVLDTSVLLPSIPKVSVRPLWKSLLDNSKTSTHGKNDPTVRKGVFAEIHVPEKRFLLEINGEIAIKSAYKCGLGSLYSLLHTPEDHLFFYPSLDLMIDARSYGNDSRYVRRSCHPNAQIKCITLASHGKGDENYNDQTVHLGLFTLEDVEKGEELSVAWDWQRGTNLWKKYTEWKRLRQQSPQPTMAILADAQVENMLDGFEKEFGECACQDKDDCFVAYLKDVHQSSYSKMKGAQRRRQQLPSTSFNNDTRPIGTAQERQAKDTSKQPSRLTPALLPNQKQKVSSTKAIGKVTRHRNSKSNTSVNLTTINMDAKNDLFFASLPTSRATSPVHNAKLLHSSTETLETSAASTAMATTTVVDLGCDTVNLNKKYVASSRLPCKKAWMKTYLAEMAAPALSSSTLKGNDITGFWDETDAKPDRDKDDDDSMTFMETKHEPVETCGTTDNGATTSMMDDMVMDESLGDDSSTATLPLDTSNDMMVVSDHCDSSYSTFDKLANGVTTSTTAAGSLSSSKAGNATFLEMDVDSSTTTSSYSVIKVSPSYTDKDDSDVNAATHPPSKPVKAKLSLQEYLSMRKKGN